MTTQKCKECDCKLPADAPEGLCPACLMGNVLESDETIGQAEPPQTGENVKYFGNYELLEELSHGGMGVVYKAKQTGLNRIVALKMILSGQFASEDDVKRFKIEAEAAANLNHTNIVPIYEIGEHKDQHYFSMKLIESGDLSDVIDDLKTDYSIVVQIMIKSAQAIHHAHQRGIIHRDLKPQNIMIDKYGEPQITDFGIAKSIRDEHQLTVTGAVMGSPSYMSPEQANAEKEITTSADIYGLGAILYHLLTGRPPFKEKTAMATMLKVVSEPATPLRKIKADIPEDLEIICLKCLEKNPEKRFSSAEELARDLQRWLKHEPILSKKVGSVERLQKWVKRKPALAGFLIVSCLSFILLLGLSLWFNNKLVKQNNKIELAQKEALEERDIAIKAKESAEKAMKEAIAAKADASKARENVTYIGTPVIYQHQDLDYSPEAIRSAYKKACDEYGIKLSKIEVDDSEYPHLVYGKFEKGQKIPGFSEITTHLPAKYKYSGGTNGQSFCVNITPGSAHPVNLKEKIAKRIVLRMQVLREKLK